METIKPFKQKKQRYTQLFDSKGKPIKDVVAITGYRDGIVIGTKHGLYTNVKELINTFTHKK